MGKFRVVLLLLLLTAGFGFWMAPEAGAARYTVAQCGWHVGHDASWADTSADKFSRSSYCQAPGSADPFENVHLNSQTRTSTDKVSGTRFARWRWQAPPGTGIVTVRGQRWHVLFEGFQHRIGSVPPNGSFSPFEQYSDTDTVKRDFAGSFSPFASAIESRLLCARAEDKTCAAEWNSLAGVRGLTFTLDDSNRPTTAVGGPLSTGSWLRGAQSISFSDADSGSGLRYSQTLVDGAIRAQTEHGCSKSLIAGQWRGTKMRPCGTSTSGVHRLSTSSLSDGPHQLRQCAVDFAGNSGCLADRTIRTDNTAPGAPRNLAVAGGDGWHRSNGFRLEWQNPDQGPAAPVFGHVFRVKGAGGFDSGPVPAAGPGPLPAALVPGPGEYRISVWLIDMAGNSNPAAAAEATLRLDDVPPTAWFEDPPAGRPELLQVPVADAHSGVAGGRISYRRQGSDAWQKLPTELVGNTAGTGLEAVFPSEEVPAGTYEFQAVVLDRAGNATVTGKRGNGSVLTLNAPRKQRTVVTAKLTLEGRSGLALKVPFGKTAKVTGRLSGASGSGLAGQVVEVLQDPASGSRARASSRPATTGREGFYSFTLDPGATRKVTVRFMGNDRYGESGAGPLHLKVKASLKLRAAPRRLETGEKLRLRGTVRSNWAKPSGRGNLVAIQYLETDSGKWRPVLVTRANRQGRFNASYRFRYITGSARIRMRAVLLPSSRFPYETATSKPVEVEVRG